MFSPPDKTSSIENNDPRVEAQASPLRQSDLRLAWQLIEMYTPGLPGEDHQFIERRVHYHLGQLRRAFPSFEELRDKRVLDLACGSRGYTDDTIGRYEPWMCRLLLHLGAKPVGIDVAEQRDENFTSYRADLTIPDALSFLEDRSFDAVYICAFPTRKAISHLNGKGLTWPHVRDNILAHVKRCLKQDGTIIRQFEPDDEKLVRETLAAAAPSPSARPLTQSPYNLPRHYFDDDEYLL